MKIKKSSREMIVSEIDYVINKMKEMDDLVQKLYYFSGVQAIIQRIFNIDYDPELVFAFYVLKSTHEAFLNRYSAIEQGGDRAVIIFQEQVDGLIEALEKFAEKLKNKKNVDSVLKKFIVLLYSTTGNGFYLLQKGVLKI